MPAVSYQHEAGATLPVSSGFPYAGILPGVAGFGAQTHYFFASWGVTDRYSSNDP